MRPRLLFRLILCPFFVALLLAPVPARADDSVPAGWTTPLPPFRIADGLFYVGSRELAAYLLVTPAGDILINSDYTTSPPQIRQSVEQLGFHWKDIKILLISHAHADHAGGSAEIVRETGARYEVMEGDAGTIESGGATDFAFGHRGKSNRYPRAHVDRALHDGDTVSLGGTVLTAHLTPGHTPGCTTWSLRVHVPGEPASVLRNAVIVGSWNVLPSYHLVPSPGHPASYPGIAQDFEHSFQVLRSLPCDVFLGAHGEYFDMAAKLKRMPAEGDQVWIDPGGYQRAISRADAAFQSKLAADTAAASRR